MVGDTSYDMAMARAAGVGAIGVAWGYHPVASLVEAGATTILERFEDLLDLGRAGAREAVLPAGRGRRPRATEHRVLLDGRPLRTPGQRALALPSAALAAAVAAEWRAQGETIRPATMPLTRLASTALDRMPALRAAAIAGGRAATPTTDLLCYRAAAPLDLVRAAGGRSGSRCSTGRRAPTAPGSR